MPRVANPNRPEYARVLAEARADREISQAMLGNLIGRDAASIKKYEAGSVTPPFFVLLSLAKELSISGRRLVELVLHTIPDAEEWMRAAYEEADEFIGQTDVVATPLHNPERIVLQHEGKEKIISMPEFLFKVSDIMDFARHTYNDIVLTKTRNLMVDILEKDYSDNEISKYIIDDSLYPH